MVPCRVLVMCGTSENELKGHYGPKLLSEVPFALSRESKAANIIKFRGGTFYVRC